MLGETALLISAKQDELRATKQGFYRKEKPWEELEAAALAVMEAMQQAELRRFGRIKTKITKAALASLMR